MTNVENDFESTAKDLAKIGIITNPRHIYLAEHGTQYDHDASLEEQGDILKNGRTRGTERSRIKANLKQGHIE